MAPGTTSVSEVDMSSEMNTSANVHMSENTPEEPVFSDRSTVNVTAKQCWGFFVFTLTTFLMISDLVTDVWVIVLYGRKHELMFLSVQASLLIIAGLIVAVAYSRQIRADGDLRVSTIYLYLCLNFPLQVGVIYQRCLHGADKYRNCCTCQNPGVKNSYGPRGKPSNVDRKFANLKLLQSVFHCTPQLTGNLLHMLIHGEVSHPVQIVSAVCSFSSLVFGVVLHEKAKQEHVQGSLMDYCNVICLFVYKTTMISARIIVLVYFMYYFGSWVTLILLPHFGILLSYFLYLYRQIWKVQYHVIVQYSLYSLLDYFPIHSEYKPEGEVVLFYILCVVENIVMVGLPFWVNPARIIERSLPPSSYLYFNSMLFVVTGSVLGTIFLAVYYLLTHKPQHSLRDTRLAWLACLCEWRKYGHSTDSTGAQGDTHNRIKNGIVANCTRESDTNGHTALNTSTFNTYTEVDKTSKQEPTNNNGILVKTV